MYLFQGAKVYKKNVISKFFLKLKQKARTLICTSLHYTYINSDFLEELSAERNLENRINREEIHEFLCGTFCLNIIVTKKFYLLVAMIYLHATSELTTSLNTEAKSVLWNETAITKSYVWTNAVHTARTVNYKLTTLLVNRNG